MTDTYVSNLVVAHNCCTARMLPGEAELASERTDLPGGGAKRVQRFERSNGLDIALYKNYLFFDRRASSIKWKSLESNGHAELQIAVREEI